MSNYPFPDDRYYDREHHMWVRPNDQGHLVVGIDVLGLEALGDLAYLTIGVLGSEVQRGQPMGTLEAAKMTGDLVSPVSGTIVACNDAVVVNPSLVNKTPYNEGWMVVINPSGWEQERPELASGEALAPWIASELQRYREEGWID